jgi:hypothetical protein
MSVYKETALIIKQLKQAEKQIYDDACDYGVPIFSNNDKAIGFVKQMRLMYWGSNCSESTERYSTGATQTINIELIDEFGDGEPFMVTFTYVHINKKYQKGYRRTGKKLQGYLSITSPKWD